MLYKTLIAICIVFISCQEAQQETIGVVYDFKNYIWRGDRYRRKHFYKFKVHPDSNFIYAKDYYHIPLVPGDSVIIHYEISNPSNNYIFNSFKEIGRKKTRLWDKIPSIQSTRCNRIEIIKNKPTNNTENKIGVYQSDFKIIFNPKTIWIQKNDLIKENVEITKRNVSLLKNKNFKIETNQKNVFLIVEKNNLYLDLFYHSVHYRLFLNRIN